MTLQRPIVMHNRDFPANKTLISDDLVQSICLGALQMILGTPSSQGPFLLFALSGSLWCHYHEGNHHHLLRNADWNS
jgi:hypothetical protein